MCKCKCKGAGFYRDDRCLDYICAHMARTVVGSTEGKDGKSGKVLGPKIMSCPQRPCRCPHGRINRADLRRRIELQDRRLAGIESM